MGHAAYPLDLAARAGNLSERIQVVAALGGTAAAQYGRTPSDELGALDKWKTERLAEKLADKFLQESVHRSLPPQYTKESLVGLLSAYRLHELNLFDTPVGTRELLAQIHQSWLPTYQAALDRLDDRAEGRYQDASREDERFWLQPDVFYGQLAIVCEPFLAELGHRLHLARAAPGERDHARLSDRLVEDLQRHLLDRFEMSLAWAVEADAKVYCALHGVDAARAGRKRYRAYLDSTFADRDAYHAFFLKFPVLGRWLAHVTALLAEYGQDLFNHFSADADAIAEAFFGQEIAEFSSFAPGRGDCHAGARSVGQVEVRLADGSSAGFCYKPRSVAAEAKLQELLGTLAVDGVVGFATRAVLPRNGYGYDVLIPADRNHVDTSEQVACIYQELGGYLGIFYILGGSDLHFENIIVSDGHAFVCDCETILGVLPQGQGQAQGTLLDSVFRTALLEWPRGAPQADQPDGMKISGYAGGEEYWMPVPVSQIVGDRLSFQTSVAQRNGVRVAASTANRVYLKGTLVRPEDYESAITDGFNRVYQWFQHNPDAAVRRISEVFGGIDVRFVNWSTRIYQQLLLAARHPKCLAEPLEVDLLANTVRTFPRIWDRDNVLAERESRSLWQLDVPLFSAEARDDRLVHDHAERLPSPLELPPLDHATRRIGGLTDQNRVQQTQYIQASLVAEVAGDPFVRAATDYAARLGDRLCAELQQPGSPSPWTSYEFANGSLVQVDIEGDLYLGTGGIALFLAYLDEIAPRDEFRQAAERAVEHTLANLNRTRLGVFGGIGGAIYLLTHLHHLWKDQRLLDQALRLADELPQRIDEDGYLDVFQGVAGLIPVLLGLADAADGYGIETAHRCADHVLRHAEADGTTLSWPVGFSEGVNANLTGFAHGAGGIGWALIALGRSTGRQDCVDAGLRAFAYESRHFDEAEQDWYDLRKSSGGVARGGRHFANAWCNGAAGIGLSRIASWATLGRTDETLLRDSYKALRVTMRNFSRIRNHTLCHGTSGNAELFLRIAEIRNEPAYRLEANVQIQSLWRDFDDARDGIVEGCGNFFPGLMLGISGFGMHCLRLAAPDRVPSVLLLDPPRNHR